MIKLEKLANLLIKKNLTISLAESCTGGLLCHYLTNVAGSSNYFKFGVVCYSNESKINILKVSKKTIKIYGAVSEKCAKEMAKGVRKLGQTNLGLSITGIAGPSGGTKNKKVGLVYIAVSDAKKVISKKFQFKGKRIEIKKNAVEEGLKMLREYIDFYKMINYTH